jgi:hypothetical protein
MRRACELSLADGTRRAKKSTMGDNVVPHPHRELMAEAEHVREVIDGPEGRARFDTAVEFATLEWLDWFNHRRVLEPIGNIPPGGSRGTLLRYARRAENGRVTNQPASGKPGAVQQR